MERWRFPEILIGVLLASLLFASGTAFEVFSQQHQSQEQPPKDDASKVVPAVSEDKRIADYTEALALLTGVLALASIAQMFFLIRADGTARIAANAADLSARAAVRIELPILRGYDAVVFRRKVDGQPQEAKQAPLSIQGLPVGDGIIGHIRVLNRGRTVAIITHARIGWAVAKDLPPEPSYSAPRVIEGGQAIPGDGNLREIEMPKLPIELTGQQFTSVRSGTVTFWYYVQLTYRDFMDEPHEVAFVWRWYDPNRDKGIARYTQSFVATLAETPEKYAKSS